jgi:NNP family nitrate/nitrite transporter-like MFS transporter
MTSDARRGHTPTLVACFLHFDLSFMLWVLLGALGAIIARDLHFDPAQKGLLVAVPILGGSLARIPMGFLADRFGGRRVGIAMLALLYVPLLAGALYGKSLPALLAVGALLGTAGASFSVALPLASRWYPPERQGLVMGIAAAGNSGTVIANLSAPLLARAIGWHGTLALATIPLTLVLVAFALMAKDAPADEGSTRPKIDVRAVLAQTDLWWFCLFYAVTFGGYVGLSGFLPVFFVDQYGVSPVTAGYLTAGAACAGSLSRPLGGWLADRIGAIRMLSAIFALVTVLYLLAASLPTLARIEVAFVSTMIAVGMGNGAVFQLVPQRFRREIGIVTGIVGALGGIGGFFLPTLLGNVRHRWGSFSAGFVVLASVAFVAFVALRVLVASRSAWRAGFRALLAEAAE